MANQNDPFIFNLPKKRIDTNESLVYVITIEAMYANLNHHWYIALDYAVLLNSFFLVVILWLVGA